MGLGVVHLSMGSYEEAIRYLKKPLEVNPKNMNVLPKLAFCYVAVGRDDEARAVASKILELQPKFSVNSWVKRFPSNDEALKERMQAALLKAGLSE